MKLREAKVTTGGRRYSRDCAGGVPKQKWAQVRTKFMRVLLEEHDNILRSYQAQKHGGGDGMGAIGGQRMDLGLGPV